MIPNDSFLNIFCITINIVGAGTVPINIKVIFIIIVIFNINIMLVINFTDLIEFS